MGAAFEVHGTVGGGLSEEIYQKCLEIELGIRQIVFEPKPELCVFYKDRMLTTKYVPDILVCRDIVVELKAVATLIPEHEAQLLNYMRVARKPIGYLVNFGPVPRVDWKRFVLSEFAI